MNMVDRVVACRRVRLQGNAVTESCTEPLGFVELINNILIFGRFAPPLPLRCSILDPFHSSARHAALYTVYPELLDSRPHPLDPRRSALDTVYCSMFSPWAGSRRPARCAQRSGPGRGPRHPRPSRTCRTTQQQGTSRPS